MITGHDILRFQPFLGMFLYFYCNLRQGLLLRKLNKNGDIENFPYGRRRVSAKWIKKWISEAKNEAAVVDLQKAMLWGKLSNVFMVVFILQAIIAIAFH
ncbi:MAG TPA: hypothetical protein VN922_13105 [Bacteroidia bacterium]|nr:hypothetical protein [Bacteroidia bacterium]